MTSKIFCESCIIITEFTNTSFVGNSVDSSFAKSVSFLNKIGIRSHASSSHKSTSRWIVGQSAYHHIYLKNCDVALVLEPDLSVRVIRYISPSISNKNLIVPFLHHEFTNSRSAFLYNAKMIESKNSTDLPVPTGAMMMLAPSRNLTDTVRCPYGHIFVMLSSSTLMHHMIQNDILIATLMKLF